MKLVLLASTALLRCAAFMSEVVPTMTIETDNGPVLINIADYDPAAHRLPGGAEPPAPIDAPKQPEPAAVERQQQPQEPTNEQQTPPAPIAAEQPQQPAATPPTLLVMKKEKKFFVVDSAGNNIERDGIDADGYKAEKDAWAAIMALNNA